MTVNRHGPLNRLCTPAATAILTVLFWQTGQPTATAGGSSQSHRNRPNLVYVMSDSHASCYWSSGGTPVIKTPNLDRLAAEGFTFSQCVSNNPICVPHRAIMLTGRYSHRNGMLTNSTKTPLSPDNPSWSVELKRQGYQLGYVGKWHVGGLQQGQFRRDGMPVEGRNVPAGPARFGFDDLWHITNGLEPTEQWLAYFDEQGHECRWSGYPPAGQMDDTLAFIERNRNTPFCVVCSWDPPHPPYTRWAPEKWVSFYQQQQFDIRPNVPAERNTPRLRQDYLHYFAQVSALDEQMGRLLDHLQKWGLAENTIVIYTSDHGDLMSSHGERNKRWPWDESIRVPFLIRWPGGIPPQRSSAAIFSSVDIAPTLLGLAGLSIPQAMQGTDFSPLLRGETFSPPSSTPIMYIRLPGVDHMLDKEPHLVDYRGVRTERYTYTRRRDDGVVTPWLLYDNERDPYQLDNLVDDPRYASVRRQLDALVRQWLARVGESFE